ncbi:hypothetical protein ACNOYE_05735 [Nannocystaceae bacterium ST9]
MKNRKITSAVVALTLVTATLSLTTEHEAQAAIEQDVEETNSEALAVLPAIAVVAVAGLAGAFLLGIAQGYMECKNKPQPAEQLADFDPLAFEYALN